MNYQEVLRNNNDTMGTDLSGSVSLRRIQDSNLHRSYPGYISNVLRCHYANPPMGSSGVEPLKLAQRFYRARPLATWIATHRQRVRWNSNPHQPGSQPRTLP